MTTLPLVSASQITLYRECPRKWAWRYLQGIQTPQHPAAAFGTEVDDTQLQPYLRDGRPIDFSRDSGYVAAAGLAFLPEPKSPGLQVQKHFTMPSPTWRDGQHVGFGFQGYIDLWLPDSIAVPDMEGGAPFVGDFKTTGDLKWAKSEEQLKVDVQAMLYATHAIYETRAKSVDLSWMYFQTKGPRKAKRTKLRVEQNHVCEQFEKINETAIEMLGVRRANPHPTELPPEPAMCGQYGGCPHQHRCNLSPAQIITAEEAKAAKQARLFLADGSDLPMNGNGTSDMLARLRAKKASTPAAPAPEPVTAKQVTLDEHIAANPRAAFLAQTPAEPPRDPRYEITGRRPDGTNVYAYETQGEPAPINPPESTLPPAPPVGQAAAPTEAAPKKRGRPAKDPKAADMAAAIATPIERPAKEVVKTITSALEGTAATHDSFEARLGAAVLQLIRVIKEVA